MATTIRTLSPVELRARLQEILDLAEGVEAAEREMRAKADELHCDWETARYTNAIAGELGGVRELLAASYPDGLVIGDLIERTEDTISVLDMAIRHAEEVGDAR